jgi:hypothetical protein
LENIVAEQKASEQKLEDELRALGQAEAARRDTEQKKLPNDLLVKTSKNRKANEDEEEREDREGEGGEEPQKDFPMGQNDDDSVDALDPNVPGQTTTEVLVSLYHKPLLWDHIPGLLVFLLPQAMTVPLGQN